MNIWFALALIAGTVLAIRIVRFCLVIVYRVNPTLHQAFIGGLERRAAREREECSHGGRRCLP